MRERCSGRPLTLAPIPPARPRPAPPPKTTNRQVDARTPITEAVFRAWHAKRSLDKKRAREEVEAERRKRGVLNGREIFLTEGFEATDDAGATGAMLYAPLLAARALQRSRKRGARVRAPLLLLPTPPPLNPPTPTNPEP